MLCLPDCWSIPRCHWVYCWFLLVYFFFFLISVVVSFISVIIIFAFFYFFFSWLCHVAGMILVPSQGIEPGSWQWKYWVLTPGPPGNSLSCSSLYFLILCTSFLCVHLFFPELSKPLYDHYRETLLGILLISCSFSSFSEIFVLFLNLEHITLSP